jgi:hypothetical protein
MGKSMSSVIMSYWMGISTRFGPNSVHQLISWVGNKLARMSRDFQNGRESTERPCVMDIRLLLQVYMTFHGLLCPAEGFRHRPGFAESFPTAAGTHTPSFKVGMGYDSFDCIPPSSSIPHFLHPTLCCLNQNFALHPKTDSEPYMRYLFIMNFGYMYRSDSFSPLKMRNPSVEGRSNVHTLVCSPHHGEP